MLTGACLGRSGLNRTTGLATLTLVIAAEIPDLDILWYLRGPISGFAHHRGFTHTLLGSPLMAALAVLLVYGWHRVQRARGGGGPPPRWGWLGGYAWLGVLSHILLDYSNSYGVRPFAPWCPHWISWDIAFIVEPVILAALILGLVTSPLLALVQEEIAGRGPRGPRGRGGAIFALVSLLLVFGLRDFQHRKAVTALRGRLYGQEEPLRVSAYPYALNPFKWLGVVETAATLQVMHVHSSPLEIDPEGRARTLYKPEESAASLAAKQSPLGRVYLDWAVYPWLEVQPRPAPQEGYSARFMDLRFAYPEGEIVSLGASVTLDRNRRVTEERFGSYGEKY